MDTAPMLLRSLTARRLLVASVAALLALVLAPAIPAHATSGNPLGGTWGLYTGKWDLTYPTYQRLRGRKKRLAARVALRPHAAWFANPDESKLVTNLGEYIRNTQHGNPNALVQFALFHQWPGGEKHRNVPMTAQEQAQYRHWIDTVVRVVGSTRALIILEPDLALDAPGGHTADPGVRLSLVRYAAQRLESLPRTSVYLEIGAPDWLSVPTAAQVLVSAGVGYTRGFAVGGTHETPLGKDAVYAAAISRRLAALGYPGRTAVLDTADNGRPFTHRQGSRKYPHGKSYGVCRNKRERRCLTLGVPPTTNVLAARRGLRLTSAQRSALAGTVDAFVWFGRPWRDQGGATFSANRMVQLGRTTPFA
jgi:hypothetical protein